MSIETVSVGSSSSGNSYIIIADGHVMILDVGLPAKKILGALAHLGIDPEDVEAVLVTHEHIDHVKSVRAVSRKCCNAVFIASRGTVEHTENFGYVPEDRLQIVEAGEAVDLNGVTIRAFRLSHDASEPLGYTAETATDKLAVVTDTGVITAEIYEAVRDAGMLVFEANHDTDMLMFGEYPYPVKVRIKGDLGHLSNDYAGEVLSKILSERKGAEKPLRIMLAHLSFHNNAPLFARQTVEDALGSAGFHRDTDYTLEVAAKEGLTFLDPLNVEDGRLVAGQGKDA